MTYNSKYIKRNAAQSLTLNWLIVVIYPAWYWICSTIEPNGFESLPERIVASVPALIAVVALTYYPSTYPYAEYMLVVSATSVMWHIVRLLHVNNMALIFVSGSYLAFFSMALGFSSVLPAAIYCFLVLLAGATLYWSQNFFNALTVSAVLITFTIISLVTIAIKKRLQDEVIESEAKLRHVLENLPVSTVYRQGAEFYANAKFFEIFGIRSGKKLELLWFDLKKKFVEKMEPLVKFHTHPSGSVKQLLINLSSVRSTDIMTIMDETARVEAQANMVFASKMASLGEMAGGVAHEINNPLAIIRSNAEFLQQRATESESMDSKLVEQRSQKIIGTTERIAQIVAGLRKISRESDPDKLESHTVGEIIGDTLAFCEARIKGRGIRLIADRNDGNNINCNSVAAVQILTNLLNNSIDALEGVEDGLISISSHQVGEWCHVYVSDNGVGVDPSIYNKIMLPFFTTKAIGKGTGLGLSISKSLAEKQGGDLFFIPQTTGAVFCVKFASVPTHKASSQISVTQFASSSHNSSPKVDRVVH